MNNAPPPNSPPRLAVALESLALLAMGSAVMMFIYAGSTDRPGAEIGVPEHDSFYHIKMALMIPEHGLMREFPWLQYVYFTQDGNAFVSHHVGFQLFLVPFVQLSQWLTGDPLPGGRWAIATCFGLNLMLLNLLLRQGDVRLRWMWIVLFLFLPDQFFGRHAYIRAIGLSLAVMQAVVLFLFQGRWLLTAIAIALYIQVYLGGVIYAPVIVAACAFAQILGPDNERRRTLTMIAWSVAGWLVGIIAYPYRSGMLEFLKLQVLGTGLTPNIEVGLEWRPYTDPWFLVRMSALLLSVWTLALVVRARTGPRLDARETALLIINFVFLLLTLKARRFIEYWPLFALLSAAFMLRPTLALIGDRAAKWAAAQVDTLRIALFMLVAAAVYAGCAAGIDHAATHTAGRLMLAEWRLWIALALLVALPSLSWQAIQATAGARTVRTASGTPPANPDHPSRTVLIALGVVSGGGAGIVAGGVGLVWRIVRADVLPPARLPVPVWAWIAIGAVYTLVPLALLAFCHRRAAAAPGKARGGVFAAIGTVLLFGAAMAMSATKFGELARGARCNYDLDQIRKLMAFVRERSQPGEIIFTDDWDVFPVFFYINAYNHYIVGLDPKFTHERRPDLWARYVRITRGETPTRSQITYTVGPAAGTTESIDIDVADIREHFGARWAIIDSDHRRFASTLAERPDVAELVYPCNDFSTCGQAAYWVFRIHPAGHAPTIPTQPDARGHLPLSKLRPISHSQGYGFLRIDRTVDERGMQMRGADYAHGLGTHAPSMTVYAVPPGFDAFEAVVGIDDETDGQGSVIAEVMLDANTVYRSPLLTGRTPPATIHISLNGATQLALKADATADGNRFDHVNWAEARFVSAKPAQPKLPRDNDAKP